MLVKIYTKRFGCLVDKLMIYVCSIWTLGDSCLGSFVCLKKCN